MTIWNPAFSGIKTDDPEHLSECMYKMCREEGDDIFPFFYEDVSVLHVAARRNAVKCITYLLRDEEMDVDILDGKLQSTPLHHAALSGSVAAMKLLLERGANPDIRNDEGFTFLDYISKDVVKKEIIEFIEILSSMNYNAKL